MVGIGFFSPLPLAYMVPFMAAQSLAMGEAFGKGFQYGKRKISAQTNEEFNKFTFQNMWDEQNTNIKMLLPSLNSQLDSSIELQKAIFAHMFELIPVFINEMAKATNTIIGNLFFQNTGDSQNPAQSIVDWIKNIWNVPDTDASESETIPFIGPPEPLPDTLQQHIDIQKELIPEKIIHKNAPDPEAESTKVYIEWLTKLNKNKLEFTTFTRQIGTLRGKNIKDWRLTQAKARLKQAIFAISSKSNEYRHSNKHIREHAIRLRIERANGKWKNTTGLSL